MRIFKSLGKGRQGLLIIRFMVAATTVWSGASYVYTMDVVRILTAARKRGTGTGTKARAGAG